MFGRLIEAAFQGSSSMNNSTSVWSPLEDARFRDMVESGASAEEIAGALRKNQRQLRRRGYDLGLPLKWFRKASPT